MAKTTQAPRTLDEYPEYAAARRRHTELVEARNRIQSRSDELTARHQGLDGEKARVLARAHALMGGDGAEHARAQAELTELARLKEEELPAYDHAIILQEAALQEAQVLARKKIREDLIPEYKKLVAGSAASFRQLMAALAAVQRFEDGLERSDVGFGPPLIRVWSPVGSEQVESWVKEQKAAGNLD